MIEVKCKTISPAALFELSDTRDVHELLDVRTTSEYASAHIPGARLIPLNELNVEMYLRQHMPGTPIYVVCQAGARAAKAIEQFEQAGCGDAILVRAEHKDGLMLDFQSTTAPSARCRSCGRFRS